MLLPQNPPPTKDSGIYLKPGDFRFFVPEPGIPRPVRLHTLLGSCISVILWHPELRIGGMSHVILPTRGRRATVAAPDARYCDDAIAMFRREVLRLGTRTQQYLTYLVGGGRMYDAISDREGFGVGDRNIEAARLHLKAAGFLLRAEDVGKDGYRKVELDLATGTVVVTFANQRRVLSLT